MDAGDQVVIGGQVNVGHGVEFGAQIDADAAVFILFQLPDPGYIVKGALPGHSPVFLIQI